MFFFIEKLKTKREKLENLDTFKQKKGWATISNRRIVKYDGVSIFILEERRLYVLHRLLILLPCKSKVFIMIT